MAAIRKASHAGSWYTDDPEELDASLSEWLSDVEDSTLPSPLSVCSTSASSSSTPLPLPVPASRAIIAPHAGYSYSGPAAAYAYRTIDTSSIRNVFILGPSHHVYLDGCAVSACSAYETPLGNLRINREITEELKATGKFSTMSKSEDEDEHSIEMHLPYIYKVFEGKNIQIVPILVGAINTSKENEFGKLLAKYVEDPSNFFVVSSDFCHWGSRFRYTYYKPSGSSLATNLTSRSSRDMLESKPIHQSIRELDEAGILAITHPWSQDGEKTAEQARLAFAKYLSETKNTVCGRHPIGVLLSALAELERSGKRSEARFTRYEQSSKCMTAHDSSVSYASAFVRFRE
ncbi:protein tag-253 [Pseudozyma hubeiensis SY62]|uniref:Protein tag-253 n=1 Tax=Pseudozyma hubeiensis (strain SY62) TaxID=1305764 RepID=R9P8F6_PSEHS|nr:protein tag-253 [Pseudozyma hubeiensis SY62]GAC97542.1 protein tag-253 [Pseudozyma hubeiensis SY62]